MKKRKNGEKGDDERGLKNGEEENKKQKGKRERREKEE